MNFDHDEIAAQYETAKTRAEGAIQRRAQTNPWVVVGIVVLASAVAFLFGYFLGGA